MKIALVTYKKQEKLSQGLTIDEDADLLGFLKDKGLDIELVIWNDEQADWSGFDVAVIKSPWDYHHHPDAFMSWLDKLEVTGITVLNPASIIRWNSHKRYLKELIQQGLPVIPAAFMDKGTGFDDRYFKEFGTEKLVVKPCISAGAQNTIVVHQDRWEEQKKEIDSLLQVGDYIVQPFVAAIKTGEWSFLFFNGVYSHAVLKTPKQGDFRVQQYHGGSISFPGPKPAYIEQAAAFLKKLPASTLYARVDGVIIDDSLQLMELELIEPYLFFNGDQTRLENYYQALTTLIAEK